MRTNLALLKTASLVGVDMRGQALQRPDEARASRERVMALARRGIFHPAIARRYPIEQFAAAMDEAFAGKVAGRIVLTMP